MKNDLWHIIDTGAGSADANMQYDTSLLEQAEILARPVLHFYEWEAPSATFGHFIDPSEWIDLERARQRGLCLARRPTGGGIIFHIWDMAFSVLMPAHLPEFSLNTLDNYGFVNRAVLDAIRDFLKGKENLSLIVEDGASLDAACRHFCMAKPTKYDVLWEGKKVAGAAQRKTKKGFLHQGSISLVMPSQEYLEDILLPGTSVSKAMQMIACPLLGALSSSETEIAAAKEHLKGLLATHLNTASLKYRLK